MFEMGRELDRRACYRVVRARDARFDGRLFVGVRTTGVYCRPICPAPTPRLQNVLFFQSAAAAQARGFRPCLRCRPESSPDLAAWRGTSNTVSRALTLIADGALNDSGDVSALAKRLGVGERHLRRLFTKHLGASPVAVAQARRVHFAKQLLHETDMRMTDVALAAGFGSLRRFNDLFQRMYGRPPSQLRRQRGARSGGHSEIQLLLSYAPPYDWAGILEFLTARSIPGLEEIDNGRYRRTIELNGSHGLIEVGPAVGRNALAARIRFPVLKALPSIVERIRVMFDLNADITQIGLELATDPYLAPLVHARPGLRVPGSWDGFEQAVRAVLGQQITVSAARQLGAVLIERFGTPIIPAYGPSLKFVFPPAARLADADLGILRIPRARAATLSAVAAAAAADGTLFESQGSLDAVVARLRALRGVGEWTAQYIAMRAAREPDAFPAADVGLLNAMTRPGGVRPTPAALLERAEAWRPWRAYAAQHLWTSGRGGGVQMLLGGPERPALRTTDNKGAVA